MQKYVVGFLFDKGMGNLILIKKTKPEWQKGRFNGVGGKVEPNETFEAAMVREFEEETGVKITNWNLFSIMNNCPEDLSKAYKIHFYRAFEELSVLQQVKTTTEEEVFIINMQDFWNGSIDVIYNLQWLIPMALDEFICKCNVNINDF